MNYPLNLVLNQTTQAKILATKKFTKIPDMTKIITEGIEIFN